MRASTDTTKKALRESATRCDAKAYPGYGGLDQVIICSHCGDVTNEPRCPHDTPRQSNSGLDI